MLIKKPEIIEIYFPSIFYLCPKNLITKVKINFVCYHSHHYTLHGGCEVQSPYVFYYKKSFEEKLQAFELKAAYKFD